MRAVAVRPGQPGSLHVRDDVPEPEPGPAEALVRALEAGICGTDVEIHHGLLGRPPEGCDYLVLGHENLGVVESAPSASRLRPGDLVVGTVRRPCPEACAPCAAGQNDACQSGHYLERGIFGHHGFMSERYAESPDFLVTVPAALRAVAILIEPLSVVEKGIDQALRVQQRLPWPVQQAVVLGAGPVGMLAGAALRLRGLDVTVASREPEGSFKAGLLAVAGIHYVSTAATPLDRLRSRLGGSDLVFEATGAAAVVLPALGLLAPNGVAVLTSVSGGEHRAELDVAAWNREMVLGNRLVLGTVNAARRHFEAAVHDLAEAEARLPGWMSRLLTRRLPYAEAARALERPPDDIKTVMEFS